MNISFRRSICIPDQDASLFPPPDPGALPLESVSKYKPWFLKGMSDKRGAFFPMYQKEAMFIKFESKKRYCIKISLGDTNVISGEPATETAATVLRRQAKFGEVGNRRANLRQKELQDYFVVPRQESVHNIARIAGPRCQFLAKPHPSSYSVEVQISEQENPGGLRIEVTPSNEPPGLLVYVKYTRNKETV